MSRSDRDWTIAQLHYRDPDLTSPSGWRHRCERYVVSSPFKSEACVRVIP
jgi:hypothetical protein